MKEINEWSFERRKRVARILDDLLEDVQSEYDPGLSHEEVKRVLRIERAIFDQMDKLMPEWAG